MRKEDVNCREQVEGLRKKKAKLQELGSELEDKLRD